MGRARPHADPSALRRDRPSGVGRALRGLRVLLLLAMLAGALLLLVGRGTAPLDLGAPLGPLTGRRLTALTQSPHACRAALMRAGIAFAALPPRGDGAQCGYADGVRLLPGGARTLAIAPPLAASCSVAAALAVWEWEVVQPAALRHYGMTARGIETFGTYNCRRIAGSRSGGWSEHAQARAVDIAGITLADGHRITVAADGRAPGRDAAFLRDIRDGACRLFATVLSPDFNAAHRDHLHLDQAARGIAGWRACR